MYKLIFLLVFNLSCDSPNQIDSEEAAVPDKVSTTSAQSDSTDVLPAKLRLTEDELLGKINPAKNSGFSKIASQYTSKTNIYLRNETYDKFVQMAQAAKKEGIQLHIISATRNFAAQKSIWEAKWNGQRKVSGQDLSKSIADPAQRALKILEYSSMPGTSRHHWGTDLDLNALNNAYFAKGEGKKIYDWLLAHAHKYGFCQVYTEKGPDRPDGYHEEKWHWSYMPLSHQFLEQYNELIGYEKLGGFDGDQVAEKIDAIGKYVNGIAPQCKKWQD